MNESMNCNNVGKRNIMSDIEEENMLSFHTGIGEISLDGFSRNQNLKMMMSLKNLHTHLNHYRQEQLHDTHLSHCERELSSMSLQGHFTSQRFTLNKYPSSHRSVDCRSKSPLSLHSGVSVRSAIDITNALNCESFNMHELQIIKDLVCRKLKHQLRKRYERKRNKYILLKANHNKIKKINSTRHSRESPSYSDEDSEHSIKTAINIRGPQSVNKSLLMTMPPHTMEIKKNMSHKNINHTADIIKAVSTHDGNTLQCISTEKHKILSQALNKTTIATEDIFPHHDIDKPSINDQCSSDAKIIKLSITTNPITNVETDLFQKPVEPKKSSRKNKKECIISNVLETLSPLSESNQKVNKELTKREVSKINEVLMKTSFSKRKLFTQKVDLLSDKVVGDSAGARPKAKVDKEKNKARKLVTTQSCLNRNVSDEEGNVLDLIHKIVPAEQINATCSKIKTKPCFDDKCGSDLSEKCTDETLHSTILETESKKDNNDTGHGRPKLRDCSIVLCNIDCKNIPRNLFQSKCCHCQQSGELEVLCNNVESGNKLPEEEIIISGSKCVKSFWDTDVESEKESEMFTICKLPKPSRAQSQQKNVNSTTLNATKHKVRKIGDVFTVQDFINKRNIKKKTLNIEVLNVKDKSRVNTECTRDSRHEDDNKENIYKNQNKLKHVRRTKTRNVFVDQSKVVKEKISKIKPTAGNSDLTRKSKRSNISNRNCSGCEIFTKYTKSKNGETRASNGKRNERATRTNPIVYPSLDSSDSFTISLRSRSKQRNKSFETSKENISQLSNNCNITLLSLRSRKMIGKPDSIALIKPRSRRVN